METPLALPFADSHCISQVFISHAGEHFAEAALIHQLLKKHGVSHFFDTQSFLPGQVDAARLLNTVFIPNTQHGVIIVISDMFFSQPRSWAYDETMKFLELKGNNFKFALIRACSEEKRTQENELVETILNTIKKTKAQAQVFSLRQRKEAVSWLVKDVRVRDLEAKCSDCGHSFNPSREYTWNDGQWYYKQFWICAKSTHVRKTHWIAIHDSFPLPDPPKNGKVEVNRKSLQLQAKGNDKTTTIDIDKAADVLKIIILAFSLTYADPDLKGERVFNLSQWFLNNSTSVVDQLKQFFQDNASNLTRNAERIPPLLDPILQDTEKYQYAPYDFAFVFRNTTHSRLMDALQGQLEKYGFSFTTNQEQAAALIPVVDTTWEDDKFLKSKKSWQFVIPLFLSQENWLELKRKVPSLTKVSGLVKDGKASITNQAKQTETVTNRTYRPETDAEFVKRVVKFILRLSKWGGAFGFSFWKNRYLMCCQCKNRLKHHLELGLAKGGVHFRLSLGCNHCKADALRSCWNLSLMECLIHLSSLEAGTSVPASDEIPTPVVTKPLHIFGKSIPIDESILVSEFNKHCSTMTGENYQLNLSGWTIQVPDRHRLIVSANISGTVTFLVHNPILGPRNMPVAVQKLQASCNVLVNTKEGKLSGTVEEVTSPLLSKLPHEARQLIQKLLSGPKEELQNRIDRATNDIVGIYDVLKLNDLELSSSSGKISLTYDILLRL